MGKGAERCSAWLGAGGWAWGDEARGAGRGHSVRGPETKSDGVAFGAFSRGDSTSPTLRPHMDTGTEPPGSSDAVEVSPRMKQVGPGA